MSARSLLLTSFGALIAALLLQAVVAVLEARTGAALRQAEDRRHASYRLADQLRQSSDELTRFARTYAATGDARFKEYFELVLKIRDGKAPRPEGYEGIYWDFVASTHQKPALVGRPVALLDLMRSEGFQPAEFAKIAEAKALSDELVSLEAQAMEAMEGEPDQALALRLLHGPAYHAAKAAIMRPIQDFFAMVDARTRAEVQDQRERAEVLERLAVWIAIVASLLALVALLALSKRLLTPVQTAGDRIHDVAESMRATSQEQEVGAAEQSAAVEETRQTFASLLDATRNLSRAGADVLGHAEVGQKNAQAIARRIEDLSTSTRSITEILALVKAIANKSEILSLNAALEGTKAGEAGRGFSLVATQMQRLAEQVMGSVKKIESLTTEITTTSQNAVLAAEESEKVATLTTEAAREIAEAVSVQQAGAQQVAVAMDEISQVAHHSVKAAQTTVDAATQLGELSASLQRILRGGT